MKNLSIHWLHLELIVPLALIMLLIRTSVGFSLSLNVILLLFDCVDLLLDIATVVMTPRQSH